jgi:hypothetical protein
MRNILLAVLTVVMGFIVSCDDHDVLPPYKASTIFSANDTLFRVKDTIIKTGDTIKMIANGRIYDTSRKYTISATIRANDTTAAQNLLCGTFIKSVAVTFDTVGYAKTGLFRWTTTTPLLLFTPALPAGTKIKTTALFTYGLNLSSQTGNTTAADGILIGSNKNKYAYVK